LLRWLVNFEAGDKLTINIDKYKKPRTLKGNAYLHVVLEECAPVLDMPFEVAKMFLKIATGRFDVVSDTKSSYYVPRETRKMSTVELADFIAAVKQYMFDVHQYDVAPPEGRGY